MHQKTAKAIKFLGLFGAISVGASLCLNGDTQHGVGIILAALGSTGAVMKNE